MALAVLAYGCAARARAGATPGDPAGRYVVASLPPAAGAVLADATYGGAADIVPRRHAYSVTWQLTANARRLRGLGLLDGGDLLGVSLATGGPAHGLAIYHRDAGGRRWIGRWITSIDGGGAENQIEFDDQNAELRGRHRLVCRRAGGGSFEGSVNITAAGEDYLLSFEAGRTVLYRGIGVLAEGNRLVVAWSFGSSPALAVYGLDANGLLSGRRMSLHAGQPVIAREDLAREGTDALRLLPAAAREPGGAENDADPTLEPGPPDVKAWVYEELMEHYGKDGWANRWLDGQLTPEEYAMLQSALRRQRARAARAQTPPRRSIGDLIEEQRQRTDD